MRKGGSVSGKKSEYMLPSAGIASQLPCVSPSLKADLILTSPSGICKEKKQRGNKDGTSKKEEEKEHMLTHDKSS